MQQLHISQKLAIYQPENPDEAIHLEQIKRLVEENPQSFERTCYIPGHITGSAWVLSKDHQKALLTHHVKLGKWIQLGGHSDDDPDTQGVALREGQEESGLKSIHSITDEIFDVDVHLIPAHHDTPQHFHYDIRFLFEADEDEPFVRQEEESKELRWIPLDEISKYSNEESVLRMVRKTRKLFPSL